MTREELIKSYQEEDKFWSVENLMRWLIQEKGIPSEIATLAFEEAIQNVISGKIEMPTHRFDKIEGCIGFDNYVLQIAREHLRETNKMVENYIEEKINKLLKEKLSGNRFSKMWRALIGRI